MTQDEIIELAEKAKLDKELADDYCRVEYWTATEDELIAFAKLVAAKEREKWSGVEAYLIAASEGSMSRNNSEALAGELLTAIRARRTHD